MHVEVHFVTETELLHQLTELLEGVEEADATAPVEIIRFDQPNISPFVKLIIHRKLPGNNILVLQLCLDVFVLRDLLINFD